MGRYAVVAKGPRIPREQWSEVAVRAKREGLRAVARELGVSHETVRTIVKRVRRVGSDALMG
jgi:transposase